LIRVSRLLLTLVVLGGSVLAQTVTITGTVTSSSGCPYQSGQGTAKLVSGNGSGPQSWTINGTNPVNPIRPIAGLDSFGSFSVDLTNTALIDQQTAQPEWAFSFCSNEQVVPQVCFNVPALALTSSQSITTQINAAPPALLACGAVNFASPPPIGNVTPNTG